MDHLGEDRFYIIGLSDSKQTTYSGASSKYFAWYYSAFATSPSSAMITDYSSITSVEFGSGLQNTINMMEAWENKTYGSKNGNSYYYDLWYIEEILSYIGTSNSQWFEPSYQGLICAGSALGIDNDNCEEMGFTLQDH